MSRGTQALHVASILIVCVLSGTVSEAWGASLLLGLLALGALLPVRFNPGTLLQSLIAAAGFLTGWFIFPSLLVGQIGAVASAWGSLGAAILLVAIPRLYMATPLYGAFGTSVLALLAVMSCGYGQEGSLYPILALVFVLLLLAAFSRDAPGRPSWSELTSRHRLAIGGTVVFASAVAIGLTLAIPSLYYRTQMHIMPYLVSSSARAGFSDAITLGDITDMKQSGEVMMRISGPKPDYLRGIAYSNYLNGRWVVGRERTASRIELKKHPESASATIIRSVGGAKDRYFLPLEAREVAAAGELSVDGAGVLTCPPGKATEVRFSRGARDDLYLEAPNREDLRLARGLQPVLARAAEQWTDGLQSTQDKLVALEHRLRSDYHYALSFSRVAKGDPVLEFLETRKTGHCEYFASAMALLARALGIPTRVIGGYRVLEYNSLGRYYIVRERHAHAWVEAWIPEFGWQSFDPTPEAAFDTGLRTTTTGLAALTDLVSSYLGRIVTRMGGIGSDQLAILVAVLLAGLLLARRLLSMKKNKPLADVDVPEYARPLPQVEALLGLLSDRGVHLDQAGTIEALSERVRHLSDDGFDGEEVSRLLDAYAAWRYGQHGVRDEVAASIERWLDARPASQLALIDPEC